MIVGYQVPPPSPLPFGYPLMYTKDQSCRDKENSGFNLSEYTREDRNAYMKGSGLLSKRVNAPPLGQLSSLDLLHKPPKGCSSSNLYTDEEIAKNTDLNKRVGSTCPSPSSSLSIDTSLAADSLDLEPFPQPPPIPVYKKGGELVKSSLKKTRSKSLPSSPCVRDVSPPGHPTLQRSKSVHFDRKTPVKYFELDESPLVSGSHEGELEELSFQHKGVGLLQPQIESLPPLRESAKPLRKSKRFDALNKDKDKDKRSQNDNQPKLQGLYPYNFPIISSRDPKVLQLNVFLSLARGKQVFLQDLALYLTRQGGASVEGKVMVKNLSYHKRVAARYTWDGWRTVQEVECVYFCSGERFLPGTGTDTFTFRLEKTTRSSIRLELCIQYVVRIGTRRQEFWDNNEDKNYVFDVVTDSFRNPFA